ncbi:reverse transcriptase, partial [Globisporangium splendens]
MVNNEKQADTSRPFVAATAGVAGGMAVGGAIAASVVPIVNAIGFASGGIVAGSSAAEMMSAAALASGGGVASGGTVATLQSIGAVGLGGGPIAGIAIGSAVVGGVASAAIYKTCRSGQHEYVSAYEPRDKSCEPCWIVATEEGCGNVRVCRYKSEAEAQAAFDRIWCSRILYDPKGEEIKCAGVNWLAYPTIRRVMKDHYFAQWSELHNIPGITAYTAQALLRLKANRLSMWNYEKADLSCSNPECSQVVQSSVQHLFWECPKVKLVWNYFYALWAKIGITPGHDPAIWIFSMDLPDTPRHAWTTIKRHIIGHKFSNEHLQDHLYSVAHTLWRYMSASLIHAIWCAHLRRMDSDPIESTAEMAIMMTRLEAGMRNLTRLAEAQAGDSDGHTVAAVLKAYVGCFLSQTDAIPLTPSDTRGVYLLFFDGGSRGNQGPGGTGSIIVRVHKDSHTASLIWTASMAYSRKDTTNNFAEYWGLIHGLREPQRSHFEPLYVIGDSALIISQQRMHRSPRQHRLARLYQTSRRLADCIDIRGWYHHYRAFNKTADSAANLAMDTRTSTQVHFPTHRAAFNNLTQDLDNDVMHWLMRSSEDPRSLDNTRQPHIGPREHAIPNPRLLSRMPHANASYPAAPAAASPAATSGATDAASQHVPRAAGSTERSDNDSAALLWKLRVANAKKQGNGANGKNASGSSTGDSITPGDQEVSAVQDASNISRSLVTPTKSLSGSASKSGDGAASQPSTATKIGRRGPGRPKKSDDNVKHAAKWDDDVTALFLKLRFQDIRPEFERVRNNLEVGECWILLAKTLSELSGRRFDSHQCQSKLRNLKKTWREMTTSAKPTPTSSSLFQLLSQYMGDSKPDERHSSVGVHEEALSEHGVSRTRTNSSVSVDDEEKNQSDAGANKENKNEEGDDDQIDTGVGEHGDGAVSPNSGEDNGSPDVRSVTEGQSTRESTLPDIESQRRTAPMGTEQAESATDAPSSPGSSRKRQKRNSASNTPAALPVLSAAAAVSDHGGIDSGLLSVVHGLRTMVEGVIVTKNNSAEQRAILTELREHNALMKQYCAEVSKQTVSLNALIDLLAAKANKEK